VDHSEDLQLLKYKEGQFYSTQYVFFFIRFDWDVTLICIETHLFDYSSHDFIEYQVDRPCGPRILTAFLYLNDVEAGGTYINHHNNQ